MGLFKMIRQAKQATKMENEVRERLAQMDDITSLTLDNVRLQIFVMEYDIERYQKMGISADPFGNIVNWRATAKGTQGFVDIYKQVLDDGIKKWQGKAFLEKQYKAATKARSEATNDFDNLYYSGQQKAIAGLQEGVLYYEWTNPNMPIAINPKIVSIIKKRNLL